MQTSSLRFNSKSFRILFIFYLILEVLILTAMEITMAKTPLRIYTKFQFSATFLHGLMALIIFIKYGKNQIKRRENLIPLAICLQVLADTLLCLFYFINHVYGYICFCIVQILYGFYLKENWKWTIIKTLIFAAMLTLEYALGLFCSSNFFGLLNIVLIAVNTLYGWLKYCKEKSQLNLIFMIALTVFFASDCIVMTQVLVNSSLVRIITDEIIWLTYVPAQMTILYTYCKKVEF